MRGKEPNWAVLFDLAVSIAVQAHRGQRDKAGEPYILHVLHVSLQQPTMIGKIVGVLHDVVEDTNWTIEQMEEFFPREITNRLRFLTRSHGMDYDTYIEAIVQQGDVILTSVKVADLEHNMNPERIPVPDDKDGPRMAKYRRAHRRLTGKD